MSYEDAERERRSRWMKKLNKRLWKSREFRKRKVIQLQEYWNRPDHNLKMSEIARHRMNERWKLNGCAMRRKMKSKSYRQKMSKTQILNGHTWKPSLGARRLQRWLGTGWKLEFPVANHIAIDVAYPSMKFAIEVDGKSHDRPDQKVRDKERDVILKRLGWSVFRVSEEGCRLLGGVR